MSFSTLIQTVKDGLARTGTRRRCSPGHGRRRAARKAFFEQLENRTLLAAVAWDGGAGTTNWSDAHNWYSDDPIADNGVPDGGDDVLIDVDGDITVTIASAVPVINSIYSRESLSILGGSLSIATASEFDHWFSAVGHFTALGT